MDNEMQCLGASESLLQAGDAMRVLMKLAQHPILQRSSVAFIRRFVSSLLSSEVDFDAVDLATPRGDFVSKAKMLPTLQGIVNDNAEREDPKMQDITWNQILRVSPIDGSIIVHDRFQIGTIHVPSSSPYGTAAKQGTFNQNVLFASQDNNGQFVATAYRMCGSVQPSNVSIESKPDTILSGEETLAIEAILVILSAVADASNAITTCMEGRGDAALSNAYGVQKIVEHARGLLVRIDALENSARITDQRNAITPQ